MTDAANDNEQRVRAIILTTQRTGSTFLADCMRSHPEIECAGEILLGEPDDPRPSYRGAFRQAYKALRIVQSGAWRPARHMDRFFKRGTARVRCFKIMYNQLARPFARGYLVENRDIRVIHLRRDNLLKVHVSTLLMSKRRVVQAKAPVERIWTVVDPRRAIASMRAARARYEAHDRLFERHPRLHISYEDLIEGQGLQETSRARICDFLGVNQLPMKSAIMKLNPESLRDMVTNYDELAYAISRTEFADMLA
jgi:hypothetical protein